MTQTETILFLIKEIEKVALENASQTPSAMEAIKQALHFVEGSYTGY